MCLEKSRMRLQALRPCLGILGVILLLTTQVSSEGSYNTQYSGNAESSCVIVSLQL